MQKTIGESLKIFILTTVISFSFCTKAHTQIVLSDNAKISLMTTSPWSGAVYALFGHTAIYVEDNINDIEAVFNYGFFDNTKPNFMYNFIRGKTDYVLGVQSYDQFVEEYIFKGVEVIKQELNLSQHEKQRMWDALYINQLPENREYRYNFLYDNCVTRPRDIIEEFTEGEIIYPEDKNIQTYRDLLHECVGGYPWVKFGIDLIIASGADRTITLRQKMFLPVYLMNALDSSTVSLNDSCFMPIVADKEVVVIKNGEDKYIGEWDILSPLPIMFSLLIITLLISLTQIRKLNYTLYQKVFDSILFGIIGAGGIVIAFLSLFSEHPVTDSNWNFVWMNVFSLIIPLLVWLKPMKTVVYIYHFINFVVLTLLLLLWWVLPQSLPAAAIPLVLSLWLRSGTSIEMNRRLKKTGRNRM